MRLSWMLLLTVVGGGWGVATGGRSLSPLPPVADPGPCAPPTNSSAPVGLQGYRRYFANASLVGRPVPCTRDDKICFRHNLLFNPWTVRCEPIGSSRLEGCDLRPNRTEFERGGRLIGVCQTYIDPCPGYRMAYDGRCYQKEVVRDTICGCGVKPTRNFLDGVECGISPATPSDVQQPQEDGRCLIPDLRFPDIERTQFFIDLFTVNLPRNTTEKVFQPYNVRFKCNSAQAKCFAKQKVRVKGFKGCHPLLEQGPCPEEHVVGLDLVAASKGRAKGTCVHVRGGCPPGHKRMLFDGQCHEDWQMWLEVPGYVRRNVYGEHFFVGFGLDISVTMSSVSGLCSVENEVKFVGEGAARDLGLPSPYCGPNNQGLCGLYEVHAEPPIPEL